MPFLRSSFRTRLAFWYTLLLTITVIVFGIVIVVISRVSVLNTIDQMLEEAGSAIIETIRLTDDADAPVRLSLTSDGILHLPGVWVQIWQTVHGSEAITPRLLEASDALNMPAMALDPNTLSTTVPRYSTNSTNSANGSPQRVLTQPILHEGQLFGVMQVATYTQYFEQGQQALPTIILIAAVVSLLVSLITAAMLAEHAIVPSSGLRRPPARSWMPAICPRA